MSLANAIYMNILSLIVLVFIFASSRSADENTTAQQRLFLAIVISVMAFLVLDVLGRVFDGLNSPVCYCMNWVSNILLFIFTPLAPCIWMLFSDYQVNHDEKRLKAYIPFISVYMLLNMSATIASVSTGWFFTIGADNIYHRGPYVIVHATGSYAILFYITCYILIKRKRINRNHFVALLLFPLPPAIASTLQNLFYGMALVGSGLTLSVLMIYMNIQGRRLQTDYLTGLYNRRLLGDYVRDKIKDCDKDRSFSALLIDLDGFKQINDSFGHDVGDKALLDAVNLLKSCLRESDFVSRYGGDEFLIILDIDSPAVLEGTVNRIRQCFRRYNQYNLRPYPLNFSCGYAVYEMASYMSPEQFIRHVDALMYEDKKKQRL